MSRVVILTSEQIRACPHLILTPEHYTSSGTCRCTDPSHTEMRRWGYRWNKEEMKWTA